MTTTITLHEDMPEEIQAVLEESTIDGQPALRWLMMDTVEPIRKACLLNVLASMSVHPVRSPLIEFMYKVFTVKNDRIGGVFLHGIRGLMETYIDLPSLPFYLDPGTPLPIHRELLADVPPDIADPSFAKSPLISYRSEGSPSLQVVLIEGANGYTLADLDLDDHPATQDIVGFLGHQGELIKGHFHGPTDHFDMRQRLCGTAAEPFLAYSLATV